MCLYGSCKAQYMINAVMHFLYYHYSVLYLVYRGVFKPTSASSGTSAFRCPVVACERKQDAGEDWALTCEQAPGFRALWLALLACLQANSAEKKH